jgi:AcrR family transcriptional regulator
MKEKIVKKASDLFLKLGFKSITMDDIASEMCISKKTIYKYFANKEVLIEEATVSVHNEIQSKIVEIQNKNYNAVEENFVIKQMFTDMFQSTETSPVYQLKKHYPEIYATVKVQQETICKTMFERNIENGIIQGLYRKEIPIATFVNFYYNLIFMINENYQFESEIEILERQALDYHLRAIVSIKGLAELEKNLNNPIT